MTAGSINRNPALKRPPRVCKQCGCTETRACTDPKTGLGCYWVKPNLCNVCRDKNS